LPPLSFTSWTTALKNSEWVIIAFSSFAGISRLGLTTTRVFFKLFKSNPIFARLFRIVSFKTRFSYLLHRNRETVGIDCSLLKRYMSQFQNVI
jgi:hypothetical protein